MRVNGQRWEFQIGNTLVIVENAWHWSGYSQERVRVNDEVILQREGWGWFTLSSAILTDFDILDIPHAVIIGIKYKDDDYTIWCRIITEDKVYKPTDWCEAKWDTKTYLWPPEPDLFQTY